MIRYITEYKTSKGLIFWGPDIVASCRREADLIASNLFKKGSPKLEIIGRMVEKINKREDIFLN